MNDDTHVLGAVFIGECGCVVPVEASGRLGPCACERPIGSSRRPDYFAQLCAAGMRNDISRGRYVDPRAGTVTVTEHAKLWRAQQLHRDSTAARVEGSIRAAHRPGTSAAPHKSFGG